MAWLVYAWLVFTQKSKFKRLGLGLDSETSSGQLAVSPPPQARLGERKSGRVLSATPLALMGVREGQDIGIGQPLFWP